MAAYQVGAESGLLQKPVLDLAVTFQGHHKEHADVLAKTIQKLGGKPVAAKSKYDFPVQKLEVPGRRAALRRWPGAGRGQRLPGRRAALRQSRPVEGRGEHPGRRGDALGSAAQRARREPGPVGVRLLMKLAFAAVGCCLPPALAAADIQKGKELYGRCLACHALEYDRVGPRHCGLFGRRAGSVPGFAYSEAMKRSKIVWNEKTLDRFLANPLKSGAGNCDDLRRGAGGERGAPT